MPKQRALGGVAVPAYFLQKSAFKSWVLGLVLALMCWPEIGHATLCDAAAQHAAKKTGVPVDVLRAITRVETGRHIDNTLQPWPWTVNMEGEGKWFPSEYAARKFVFERFKSGARSFDVGCFQINYRWHSKAFSSIDEMFDPKTNAEYAARFLKTLHLELGTWEKAAGAYHSRTDHLARKYMSKFELVMAQLGQRSTEHAKPSGLGHTRFLVQRSDSHESHLGSLVPVTQNSNAFISFN